MLNKDDIRLGYAIATVEAKRSKCKDKKVGVTIMDEYRCVVATGYNFVIECMGNCDNCNVVHAEVVALAKVYNEPGRRLFSVQTLFPCHACQISLKDRGVEVVYYYNKTKEDKGIIKSICIKEVIDGHYKVSKN